MLLSGFGPNTTVLCWVCSDYTIGENFKHRQQVLFFVIFSYIEQVYITTVIFYFYVTKEILQINNIGLTMTCVFTYLNDGSHMKV